MDNPPLSLRISIPAPRLSVLEGIEVDLEMANRGDAPLTIPSLYDSSGALAFELRAPGGAMIAKLDGLTRQAASSPGRLDYEQTRDTLAPGQVWSRRFELCQYGALPPAGEIDVTATFDDRPRKIAARSEPARASLAEAPLASIEVSRDNPVLDRQSLLFTTRREGGGEAHVLRLCSASRPLASWSSYALNLGDLGDLGPRARPFLATNDCFAPKSFTPFFLQWVLFGDDARLFARSFRAGRPATDIVSFAIPEGRRCLRVAYLSPDGIVHALFEGPNRTLESYALREGLSLAFALRLPFSKLAAAADREGLHVVAAHRGLVHHRLSHTGEILSTRPLLRTPRTPSLLAIDAGDAARAIYTDMPRGRSARLVHVNLRTGQVAERSYDLSGHRGEIREATFARDAEGRFHFLFTTADGRLLLYGDGRGPTLVARGEARFFPTILAGEDVFLGFHRRRDGYRFVDHRPRGI